VDLTSQLGFLDRQLLAGVTTEFPDPLTDEEKASIRAYLVLSHACIEEFLEDAFSAHFSRLAAWTTKPLVPREVAGFFLAIGLNLKEEKVGPYATRTLRGAATAGEAGFAGTVRANNGLKARNLRKLAQGVGLAWAAFESALTNELADLDTLGASRGEAGHLSPFSQKAVLISPQIYPDDVRGWVEAGGEAALKIQGYLSRTVEGQVMAIVTGGSDLD
jgi:hypothetical protein